MLLKTSECINELTVLSLNRMTFSWRRVLGALSLLLLAFLCHCRLNVRTPHLGQSVLRMSLKLFMQLLKRQGSNVHRALRQNILNHVVIMNEPKAKIHYGRT